MSDAPMFAVRRVDDLTFSGPDLLATHDLMSPSVWRRDDGRFGLLLRVVEDSSTDAGGTGSIWHVTSDNGLHFTVDDTPLLTPDSDLDHKGCEDPTLVHHDGEVIVFYSGVDAAGDTEVRSGHGTGPSRGLARATTGSIAGTCRRGR